MNGGQSAGHTCSRVDNKIVVVGGYAGSSNLDSIEIFDITSEEWTAGKREQVNITLQKRPFSSKGIERKLCLLEHIL